MLNEAVLLVGGEATRLGDLAAETPKSLQPVAGRPFLDHLLFNLSRYGVTRVLFALGRLGDQVREHVGDGSAFGIEPVYVVEPEPLGTGGAVKLAASRARGDELLVANGDTLFDLNYLDLALLRREIGAEASVALRRVDDAGRYGSVTMSGSLITGFAEKRADGPGLVSGGVYVFAREALGRLPEGVSSLERDLLEPMADHGILAGREYPGVFIDIGLPESLAEAQDVVAAWRRKPAVFLDRDGVLNRDFGHVHDAGHWEWMPGAREAVKAINDSGRLAIVITNQAGIGRGYYTEDEFAAFMDWVREQLAAAGAHVDAVYHCPHHPTAGVPPYRVACDCRKPRPGMLLEAISDWGIDADSSVMIGDNDKDMEAAAAAGVAGVRYEGGDLRALVAEVLERP